jgi:hypothetical protein
MVVEHPVVLRGLTLAGVASSAGGSPTIVARTDQDFIGALLDDLGGSRAGASVSEHLVRAKPGQPRLKLLQPVHKTFNVALVEVACDVTGQPRLDPDKIDSAGLVIRRVARSGRSGPPKPGSVVERPESWVQAGRTFRGWVRLRTPRELDGDPDPARRPAELRAGHPEIDRQLALVHGTPEPLAESVAPLFVAPPEVAAATKRTVLYGLVPVASTEVSETPEPPPSYPIELVRSHVPQYLSASATATAVPGASTVVDASWADRAELAVYVTMLRQLAIECDAFGNAPAGQALFAALNEIQLPYADNIARRAGDELKRATDILVGRGTGQLTLPKEWPPVSAALADRIANAFKAAMESRLVAIVPRRGRFDDLDALYRVRAFVRVKREDGCPPKLVWSAPSEPFTIAPWYDAGPPVEITLPGLENLKDLKPNVAFKMPESLFNVLQANNLKDLTGGTGRQGGTGIGLGWICSFSIPIITLCAFIVLNIFLSLFDLIFRWLLFIKICLPIPVPTSDDS